MSEFNNFIIAEIKIDLYLCPKPFGSEINIFCSVHQKLTLNNYIYVSVSLFTQICDYITIESCTILTIYPNKSRNLFILISFKQRKYLHVSSIGISQPNFSMDVFFISLIKQRVFFTLFHSSSVYCGKTKKNAMHFQFLYCFDLQRNYIYTVERFILALRLIITNIK